MTRVVWLAATTLLLAGCGGQADRERTPETGAVIDEIAGSYGGFALDGTPAEMRKRFGRPSDTGNRALPAAKQDFTELEWPSSPEIGRRERSSIVWHNYPYVVFAFEDGRLAALQVSEAGARTKRGVAIGDDLETARDAYPEIDPDVDCFTAGGGEGADPFPACTAYLGGERYIWFGGDPIENISVGLRSLGNT